jgi:hypothetical protein
MPEILPLAARPDRPGVAVPGLCLSVAVLSKPKPRTGRTDLLGEGPIAGPEGRTIMSAISPISSTTSTTAYQPTVTQADDKPAEGTRKAGHHGGHGGHRHAEAPAPAQDPTATGTLDVMA